MAKRKHSVYVVELDREVLNSKKFYEANPDHNAALECFYVGQTGLDPDVRFDNHKRGYKGNRYIKKFGLYLRPDLYEKYNPMSYQDSLRLEEEIALWLRGLGHAVWFS